MKIDLEKVKVIALKHGVPALEEILLEFAFPLLEEAVQQSETKIDDVVLEALEPLLKEAALKLVEKVK